MINNEFTSKILAYLESPGKEINEALLEEAAKRTKYAFKRQLMEDREDQPGVLRISSGGHCVRKQWYNYAGAEREPLSGRTINTFLTGDLLEVGLSVLGRLAGWQLLGKPEGEDEVEVAGVKGHPDDLLFHEGKYYVVEYKTMSDYSYRKFEKDGMDDTFSYLTQISLYMEALGVEQGILVAQAKSTGHICDQVITKRQDLIDKAKERWARIRDVDTMPDREHVAEPETKYNRSASMKAQKADPDAAGIYDETGRATLGIVCSYCSFKTKCWPEAQQDFKGEKPIWVVPSQQPMEV